MKRLKLSKSGYKSGRRRKMSKEDVFKMMTQEEHDDYTRELENKIVFLMESLMNYNSMTSEDIDELLLDVQKIGGTEDE